MAYVILST